MKILGNYFSMQVNKPTKKIKDKAVTAANSKKTAQVTDSITISSNREDVAPVNFASMLKAGLNEKIREEKTEEQLDLIAEKIASGNYKIEADEIAKKILLRG